MAGDKWVLLHFNNGINTDSDFQLSVQGLMTATGTEIDAQDIRISYQIDTIPPYIRSVNLHDKDKIELIFSNLPADKSGEIRIFNLAGELIYKHKLNNCTEFAWDGKNNHQQIVSSGIYTYLVKMGNDFKKGKLVLIK